LAIVCNGTKSRAKKAHSTDFLISFADWHFMIYSSKLRFHTFLCVSVAILFTRRSSHAARTHASRAPLAIRWHSYFRFRSSRIRIELKPQKRSDWVALPACHWPRVRSSRVSVANCLARWSPQPSKLIIYWENIKKKVWVPKKSYIFR